MVWAALVCRLWEYISAVAAFSWYGHVASGAALQTGWAMGHGQV